ncbi:MAG: hypothetical protein KJ579_09390 [Verrucomicrobia bacterium]|nr:hypothetical protein [Verrucomicrobiota bacterium]
MTPILAIDPGASGGYAWRDAEGIVHAAALPEGMTAQVDALRALAAGTPGLTAVVERVGWWMPGDHPNSACKFARHCGHLEAALYALGVPSRTVPPQVWMKTLGTLPKAKPDRKRAIRELVARRHPHLTVTLATADALGILEWATAREGGDR